MTQRTNLPATSTPLFIATRMIDLADLRIMRSMLEPSAGRGEIAIPAAHDGVDVSMVELNGEMAEALDALDIGPIQHGDFLQIDPNSTWTLAREQAKRFDAVVMNPPMNALPHVLHAAKFLKPGGRLVALLHSPVAEEARAALGGKIDFLPQDTFTFEGRVIPSAIYSATVR